MPPPPSSPQKKETSAIDLARKADFRIIAHVGRKNAHPMRIFPSGRKLIGGFTSTSKTC